MTENLLKDSWKGLDSSELRFLLNKEVGGPGQYDSHSDNPNQLYLPLAGSFCRIALTFRQKRIVAIDPGQAFDASEWDRVSEEIEKSIRWFSRLDLLADPFEGSTPLPHIHLRHSQSEKEHPSPPKARAIWTTTVHRRTVFFCAGRENSHGRS